MQQEALTDPTPPIAPHNVDPSLHPTTQPPDISFLRNRTPFIVPSLAYPSLLPEQHMRHKRKGMGTTYRIEQNPSASANTWDSWSRSTCACIFSTVVCPIHIKWTCDARSGPVNNMNTAALGKCELSYC
jgi:hypothetical protein